MTASRLIDLFYPIVPDITWLKRLIPLGVRTVQLRLKDAMPGEVIRQVGEAVQVARDNGCQLIVNDHWQAAITAGANFIHLGQDDLAQADIQAIRRSGLRLGVSTHDSAELRTALSVEPDYIALGPVFPTKLKAMPWAPQGVEKVTEWSRKIGGIPLVAIGGITPERAGDVINAGASSVAVITDFLTHPEPEARVTTWLAWAAALRNTAASRTVARL